MHFDTVSYCMNHNKQQVGSSVTMNTHQYPTTYNHPTEDVASLDTTVITPTNTQKYLG